MNPLKQETWEEVQLGMVKGEYPNIPKWMFRPLFQVCWYIALIMIHLRIVALGFYTACKVLVLLYYRLKLEALYVKWFIHTLIG